MNNLTLPPAANWYQPQISVCAPDNTFIYGANNAIAVIKPAPSDRPTDISIISFAHLDRITALSLAPTWTATHQVVASIADDKVVKVWNLLDKSCVYSHKAHKSSKNRPLGLGFTSDNSLVSVDECGLIISWKMTTNDLKSFKDLLGYRVRVTAMSICPHDTHLAAFGLRTGLIMLADLRGKGSVLMKLKGHDREIADFAWCPTTVNVIPEYKKQTNKNLKNKASDDDAKTTDNDRQTETGDATEQQTEIVAPKEDEDTIDATETNLQCVVDAQEAQQVEEVANTDHSQQKTEIEEPKQDEDTIDAMPANGTHLQCAAEAQQMHGVEDVAGTVSEQNTKDKKKNLWVGLKHADDDDLGATDPREEVLNKTDDFLSECLALKAKITELNEAEEESSIVVEVADVEKPKEGRKILKAVRDKTATNTAPSASNLEETHIETVCADDPSTKTTGEVIEPEEAAAEVVQSEEDKPPEKEYLLASAGRGGSIVIWRARTDGRILKRMRIPKTQNSRYNFYLTINWILPDMLLSSGTLGEMNYFQVCDQDPKAKLITADHAKQLFCITSPLCIEPDSDVNSYSKKLEDIYVWTSGQDKDIIYSHVKSKEVICCFPTFSSSVQVIAASPFAPTKLALGLTDGFVRYWDLSKEHTQKMDMVQTKSKSGGKVISLAWHPKKEFILAFGTDGGQVGIYTSSQKYKPPVCYTQHFRKAIHKMEWAPISAGFDKDGSEPKFGLYVCAEGTIGVYNPITTIINPKVITLPKSESISQFAWKVDYSKLAVGCKNGTVYILSPNFEIQTTLYYQKKSICCMVWHPLATAEDEENSKNHDWLATSSDNSVTIFDLEKVKGEFSMKDILVAELAGHVKPINQLMWSPYKNGELVTVSEDGTAMIWVDMKHVGTYVNTSAEPLLCGIWSPLNEHFLITAGKDCSVRIWSKTDQPMKDKSLIEAERSNRKKLLTPFKNQKEELELTEAKKPQKATTLLGEIASRQAHLPTSVLDCQEMFYHLIGKEDNSKNCIVQLFGDHDAAVKLIEKQKEAHRAKGKNALQQHLSIWSGDIAETIKKGIIDGNLNPFLLTIAPMTSYKLWQEAIEAYAVQLAEAVNSDPIEVASYYLALHKVDEAIDILCRKQLHREAFVLAKFKKPDDKLLHKEILSQWTKLCITTGRYEIAAQSYLAEGEFEEAAKTLYKRTDLPSLALAIELATHIGNAELTNTIQFRHDQIEADLEDRLKLPTLKELAVLQAAANEETKEMKKHLSKTEMLQQNCDAEVDNKQNGDGNDTDKGEGTDKGNGMEKPNDSDNNKTDGESKEIIADVSRETGDDKIMETDVPNKGGDVAVESRVGNNKENGKAEMKDTENEISGDSPSAVDPENKEQTAN